MTWHVPQILKMFPKLWESFPRAGKGSQLFGGFLIPCNLAH